MVAVNKSVYKSVGLEVDGEELVLEVGDKVKFTTNDGVVRVGILKDIKKKEDKTELVIQPTGEPQQETWKVLDIAEVVIELAE